MLVSLFSLCLCLHLSSLQKVNPATMTDAESKTNNSSMVAYSSEASKTDNLCLPSLGTDDLSLVDDCFDNPSIPSRDNEAATTRRSSTTESIKPPLPSAVPNPLNSMIDMFALMSEMMRNQANMREIQREEARKAEKHQQEQQLAQDI